MTASTNGHVEPAAAPRSPAPDHEPSLGRQVVFGFRHPVQWLRSLTAGEAVFPLVVLYGLNAVDELDRTAFGVLLPNIRESFGIDITTALTIVAISGVVALALQVPIAQFADRSTHSPGRRRRDGVGVLHRHDRVGDRVDHAHRRAAGRHSARR